MPPKKDFTEKEAAAIIDQRVADGLPVPAEERMVSYVYHCDKVAQHTGMTPGARERMRRVLRSGYFRMLRTQKALKT